MNLTNLNLTLKWPPNKVLVLSVYGLLTGLGLAYHEPWRDEIHSWLIAQLSNSLPELIHNIRYEGHPMLWYLMAYMAKQINGDFHTLQFVHWLLTLGAAYLLLNYAPFPYLVRVLLLFSYFIFYEYTIIARNYASGVLLLFLICTLFNRRHQFNGYLLLCGLMFLLFQTNVYALLIGLVLYSLIVLELVIYYLPTLKAQWQWYLLGMCIVGAGLVMALVTILPPDDINLPPGSHGGWNHWTITLCFEMLWNAFVPIPGHLPAFRNSNFLELITYIKLRTVIRAGLSALIVASIIPLFRSRLGLLSWVLVCLGMLYIMITQYIGSLRHHGHFALSALIFIWIQSHLADFQSQKPVVSFTWLTPVAKRFLTSVLIIQVLVGVICYSTDLMYPFSARQRVVSYILSNEIRNWFWAGYPSDIAESIAADLPKNRMYYPSNGQIGGFLQYDKSINRLTVPQIVDSLRRATRKPALLILNNALEPDLAKLLQLVPLKSFTGSIQQDENYYLYRYN